jgi:hypothetical protein
MIQPRPPGVFTVRRFPLQLVSIVALSFAGSLLLLGCDGGGDGPTDPGGNDPTPTITLSLSSSSINITAGTSGEVTINVTRGGGFSGAVTTTVDALTGVTVQPSTIPPGSTTGTLTFQVAASVPAGTLQANVRASGTGVQQVSATLQIQVAPPPDFSLEVNPTSLTVRRGESQTTEVQITRTGGLTGAVTLSAEGMPTGVTATFDPAAPTSNTSVLTLTAAGGATLGQASVTIKGTASGVTGEKTAALAVTVEAPAPAPDFTLAVIPPSLTVQQGQSQTAEVQITRSGGFDGAVTLAAEGLPSGVTAAFAPAAPTSNTSTLTLTAAAGAAVGTANLAVKGTAAGISGERSTALALTVTQGTSGGSGNAAWEFCEITGIPVWFAYRDGNGPWTRVNPDAQNTYRFQIDANRGGVAWVVVEQGQPQTYVYHYTREEIILAGAGQCEGTGTFKRVNGSVVGLGPLESATISLGDASTSVGMGSSTSFSLEEVEDGPQDLVAVRTEISMTEFAFVPNRFIIRRDLNPPNNSTLPPLDFTAEGFAPASAMATVSGLGANEAATLAWFFSTARGGLGSYGTNILSGSSSTFYGIPTDQLATGDFHYLLAAAVDTALAQGDVPPPSRMVGTSFGQVQNRTFPLGPPMSHPTLSTVATAPYPRLRAQWATQPEYDRFVFVSFSQPTAMSDGPGVFMGASSGFLAGAGTAVLEVPDFSPVPGWDNAWALQTGANTLWTILGSGWQGDGVINFPILQEGTEFFSATRSGKITP